MLKLLTILGLVIITVGCSESTSKLDNYVFSKFGKTIFSDAEVVSVKEVHLNHSSFDEKDVIVEGVVARVGEYNTFVVIADAAATVLILQTQIPMFDDKIKESDVGRKFRVLGKLVLGKKGLPTVEARSVVHL